MPFDLDENIVPRRGNMGLFHFGIYPTVLARSDVPQTLNGLDLFSVKSIDREFGPIIRVLMNADPDCSGIK